MARGLRMTEEAYAARMKRTAKPTNFATVGTAIEVYPTPILSDAEYKKAKPPKYRNVKTDGFDSKREAKRYAELKGMQDLGLITDLQTQVKYELIPKQKRDDGKAERAVTYTLDFQYRQDSKLIAEDAKGIRTQQGVIRRKLMLFIHGITVREV